MRDKQRIISILDKLKLIWEKYPDLRFFQLLNAIGFSSNKDWFYLEDTDLEEILERNINEKEA